MTSPQSPISLPRSLDGAPSRAVEFWSSVECAAFLRALLRELGAAGWEARHRFAVSERDYRAARSPLARWRMRWRCYVSYPRMLRRRLRDEPAPAALVVCTNTFYAPAVAIRAAQRGAPAVPVVHWVYDLYPDVLVQAGKLRADGLLARRLARTTCFTLQQAAANVFLGERLRAQANRVFGPVPRSVVVPVGAEDAPFRAHPPQPRAPGAPVRVLYCGNLGRMHDTATVAALLRRGLPEGCTLEFRAHGAGLRELPAAKNVVVGGSLPEETDWAVAMRAADIALVTLRPGAEGLVMPSKTYSAMVAGQAVLAVCPQDSDLAETVRRHDAGWVVAPGDAGALHAILARAVAQPVRLLEKRANAYRAGQENFSAQAVAPAWLELLEEVTARPERAAVVA